jgi:hypothetical protein
MQKANVGHGKPKMGKMVRRVLPCMCRSRSLYRVRVFCGAAPMQMKKKVIKKQRRSKERDIWKKLILVAEAEFEIRSSHF